MKDLFMMERIEHAQTGTSKKRSYNGDYMEIARNGEKTVIEWVKARPNVLDIEDLRDVRQVHEADIDIGVRLYMGQVCLAEIKTDTYLGESGNVLNEVLRINHTTKHQYAGYLGWTLRSPARWLLFYAPNNKSGPVIYKATFADVRFVLQKYTKKHKVYFQTTRTDEIKTTYNILIPEEEYENVFEIYKLKKAVKVAN